MTIKFILETLIRYWWLPISFSCVFSIMTFYYLSQQAQLFRSTILLAPVAQPESGALSGLGNIGGLASVAGINLGGGGSQRSKIALKMLESTEVISKFIRENDILLSTFASKGWDFGENQALLDNKIYSNGKWVRDVKYPKVAKPSDHEAARHFIENFLNVHEEPEAGFVSLSIDYYSPEVARDWLMSFVKLINQTIRNKDIKDAQNALIYLEAQVEKTMSSELKNVLYDMLAEQHKKLMLASITENYAFEIINNATLENESFHPKKRVMTIISLLFGFMLGAYISIVIATYKKNA